MRFIHDYLQILFYVFNTKISQNKTLQKKLITALSKGTIYFFIILCILGIIDGIAFAVFIVSSDTILARITYFIGTMLIVLTTIWVISLYIYKLFVVIRNSRQHRISSITSTGSRKSGVQVTVKEDDTLLPTISKYTVTAIFCILSSVLFWMVAFFVTSDTGFARLFAYHFCLFIDITVNLICFVLGYGYTNKIYAKYCGCIDGVFRNFCGKLVLLSLGVRLEDTMEVDVKKMKLQQVESITPDKSGGVSPSPTPRETDLTKDDVLV